MFARCGKGKKVENDGFHVKSSVRLRLRQCGWSEH